MRLIGMGTEGYTKYLQRPNNSVLLNTQLKLKPPTRTGQPKSKKTYSKRDAAKAVNTVRLIAFRSQEQESVSYPVVVLGPPSIPPSSVKTVATPLLRTSTRKLICTISLAREFS